MPSVVVRFPDGEKEFRFPEEELSEGDIIAHDGERYRVVSVAARGESAQTVTVERDEGVLGSERGAIVLAPIE